jgi:hypothetical protein
MTTKIKTNIIKFGEYSFTKDRAFAIKPVKPPKQVGYTMLAEFQTTSDYLYVRSDYKINPDSALQNLINHDFIVKTGITKLTVKLGGLDIQTDYNEYKFYRPLKDERMYDSSGFPNEDNVSINENDCLKFGECLTFMNQTFDKNKFDELLKAQTGPSMLQSTTNRPFGETINDKDNINILKKITSNEKNNLAIPKNGETYAIVRTKVVADKSPYHIAFVLYTHNNVNITLEAEADNRNDYQPKFCLYDTNPDGHTFHRRWSGELFKNDTSTAGSDRYNSLYNNGETIVLKTNVNNIITKINKKNKPTNDIQNNVYKKRRVGGTFKKRIYSKTKKKVTIRYKKYKKIKYKK